MKTKAVTSVKFRDQADAYLDWITTRKRNPVRPGTLVIYQSYLNAHILPELADTPLDLIENGTAKDFVACLNTKKLSPSTISQVFKVMTAVIASAVDGNGNQLYPRVWNYDFIDLPVVLQSGRDTRIVTPEQINAAILRASSGFQAMLVMLAASGARIGEIMALQGHRTTTYVCMNPGLGRPPTRVSLKGTFEFSYWDPETAILHVNSTFSHNRMSQDTKTEAGTRQIDLHPAINDYLKTMNLPTEGFLFPNSVGTAPRYNTILDNLNDLGINEGFHAFRRFRITHLETQGVPPAVQRYWSGHADRDVHQGYMKISQDLQTRRDWAIKAGCGFTLPNQTVR